MLLTIIVLLSVTAIAVADEDNHAEPHKVTICHVPPGNPDNPLTLEVDAEGWNGHKNHPDDYEGPCQGSTTTSKPSTTTSSTTAPTTTTEPSTTTTEPSTTTTTTVPSTTTSQPTTTLPVTTTQPPPTTSSATTIVTVPQTAAPTSIAKQTATTTTISQTTTIPSTGRTLANTGFGEFGRFLVTLGLVLLVGGLAGLYCRKRRSRSKNDDTGSLEP
jgi:LPXTG-motif cell wall-anchored protein